MNTTAEREVIKTEGATRQKLADKMTSVAVRVRCKTKSKLESMLRQANKHRLSVIFFRIEGHNSRAIIRALLALQH